MSLGVTALRICLQDSKQQKQTLLFLFLALIPVNAVEHEAAVLLVRLLAAFSYD